VSVFVIQALKIGLSFLVLVSVPALLYEYLPRLFGYKRVHQIREGIYEVPPHKAFVGGMKADYWSRSECGWWDDQDRKFHVLKFGWRWRR
jgi:hypothetical protein